MKEILVLCPFGVDKGLLSKAARLSGGELRALVPAEEVETAAEYGAGRIFELSAPEVSDLREACKTEAQKADFGFHLVIASVVDDTGAPTFTANDLPTLRASAQSRIGELVSAVMAVNGFSVKEEAAKN